MNPLQLTASGTVPGYSCVKLVGTDQVAVTTAASDVVFGVTTFSQKASGQTIELQSDENSTRLLRAGGTIAAGDFLVPSTNGTVVASSSGVFIASEPAVSGETFWASQVQFAGGTRSVSISGTSGNGFNYTFNSDVNTITPTGSSGSNANTISGGGNSANPNLILNNATEPTCAYRTISGGYDNVLGSTNLGDGSIASTIAGGAHHRVRRPTDTSDNPNPALSGLNPAPTTACLTLDQPDHGTVGGGGYNAIRNGNYGTIAGGENNVLEGENATYNTAQGATIGGGSINFATGNQSTIAGGIYNKAQQIWSAICGGYENYIQILDASLFSNNSSAIGGGKQNRIYNGGAATIGGGLTNRIGASSDAANDRGTGATISGGVSNVVGTSTLAARYSTITGGQSNTTKQWWSTVIGGLNNSAGGGGTTQGEYSVAFGKDAISQAHMAFTQGGGKFSANGDCQSSVIVIKCQTTGASATTLAPGGFGANLGVVQVPSDSAWAFRCLIIARQTNSNLQAAFDVKGLVSNNAGTAAIIGTTSGLTPYANDASAASWTISVTVSGTNLLIQANGAAATTINWVGRLETSEVTA